MSGNHSNHELWQLRPSRPPECCRWVSADGRWVSLTLCPHEQEMGRVLVRESSGRTELVDTYEDALQLARGWRNE
jgi:hypothetical protein